MLMRVRVSRWFLRYVQRAEGHHSGKCRGEGLNYTRLQQQSTDIKMLAKPECHQTQKCGCETPKSKLLYKVIIIQKDPNYEKIVGVVNSYKALEKAE